MLKLRNISQWKKVCISIVISLLFLIYISITTIDYSPLKEQHYYQESKKILADVVWDLKDTTQVKAGWAKANITPDFPVKVIGFGKREFSQKVEDSLYVRSIVFRQGAKNYLYLSYDLMIVHPLLVNYLELKLSEENLKFSGIYYSATHTHNGIGGFADKIAGWIALGGKDEKVLELIASQTVQSIRKSLTQLSEVSYYSTQKQTNHMVKNRLNKENGSVDSTIYTLFLKNSVGDVASITTFSAHATTLPRKLYSISSDYPGEFVRLNEDSLEIDLSLFSAGAVGSHEPNVFDLTLESKNNYAKALSDEFLDGVQNKEFKPLKSIAYIEIELPLREPHFKISERLRLRPWIFRLGFGEGHGKLSFLKIGEVCFVGTPCDFSGELVLEIKEELKNKTINPVITSFNGEYIGYITPDKYYDWDTHEVRSVNWFGPYNGQYFKESILEVLEKIEGK